MTAEREQGHGPALVLIPGINGPWEWAGPAIDALARTFRVLSFSLSAGGDGRSEIECDVDQVIRMLEARRIERAIICGISYGGVVAANFAANFPSRVSALIVASAPGAGWHLRPRHEMYARWPLVFAPIFFLEAPFRLRHELAGTFPSLPDRLRFTRWQMTRLIAAPLSVSQMANRARALASHDIVADCRRIAAPTLVVTGERALDRVVPVESTATYTQFIDGARSIVLERTGHLGTITRPDAFAAAVETFVRGAGVALRSEVA
jgi:pimeloyl-ACP methyl ester carboxylesterase